MKLLGRTYCLKFFHFVYHINVSLTNCESIQLVMQPTLAVIMRNDENDHDLNVFKILRKLKLLVY